MRGANSLRLSESASVITPLASCEMLSACFSLIDHPNRLTAANPICQNFSTAEGLSTS